MSVEEYVSHIRGNTIGISWSSSQQYFFVPRTSLIIGEMRAFWPNTLNVTYNRTVQLNVAQDLADVYCTSASICQQVYLEISMEDFIFNIHFITIFQCVDAIHYQMQYRADIVISSWVDAMLILVEQVGLPS